MKNRYMMVWKTVTPCYAKPLHRSMENRYIVVWKLHTYTCWVWRIYCIYIHIYIHIRTHVGWREFIVYIYMYVYIYIYIYIYVHMLGGENSHSLHDMQRQGFDVKGECMCYIYIYMHVWIYVHIHTYAYICISMLQHDMQGQGFDVKGADSCAIRCRFGGQVQVFACICMYIYTYIHTYTQRIQNILFICVVVRVLNIWYVCMYTVQNQCMYVHACMLVCIGV